MMLARKLIFLVTLCMCSASFTGCSNNDEEMAEAQSAPAKDTTFPIVVDVNTTQQVVVVDGKTFTINVQQSPITRAIGGNEKIYPRDPKATLSSVPVLVSKGKYKKYAVKQFTPFANLRGASYVLLRLDKFAFECKAPANAKTTSIDITNITNQGFATESASYRGFSIDKILSTTSGVVVKCSFYIQNGKAFNIGGQQLTSDKEYPLPGNQVRYQFTYELRK